jgi:alpha-1,2-mannosyltransferase
MTSLRDSTARGPAFRLALAGWTVLALAIVLYYFRFRSDYGGTEIFLRAGDCLVRGEPLATCSLGYAYPPFFALLMVPLSILPLEAGKLAWYTVLIATTYGSFRLCEALTVKAFGVTRRELFWVRLFAVILSLKFVLAVFGNQAYDGLVFCVLLVGLYGVSENRTFLGAFGLAAAAALKATPLLMLLYPLLLRKWRLVALGVALCAVLSILPDVVFPARDANAGHLRTWIAQIASGGLLGTRPEGAYAQFFEGATYFNQSLKTFVYRLVEPRNLAWGDLGARAQAILHAVYLVYCLAALAVILRSARMQGAQLWGASVVLISMLLLSPISSKSHFVVLMLPYMVIVAYLARHREAWGAALPLLGASVLLNLLASRGLAGRELSVQMMSLGSITIATLLLFAAVAVIVFRAGKTTSPERPKNASN